MDSKSVQNNGWGQAPSLSQDYTKMPITHLFSLKASELSPVDFIVVRDRLLAEWESSKITLETAKADEMNLRKVFVDFTSDPNKTSGTENIELGNGYVAKTVKKENYGFVKSDDGKIDKNAIDKALDSIEDTVEGGKLLAERLVKWDPSLSVSEYKKLPAEAKAIIDKVIVLSSGAPTLEIKAPKGSK